MQHSIPLFIQIDLLLAEFFASITITMISFFVYRAEITQLSDIPLIWHAVFLLGASNTILAYRSLKQAARDGVDALNLPKASFVWTVSVFAWAMFITGPEGTWRACLANTPQATLVLPYILAQVVVTGRIGRRFGYFQAPAPP